MYGTAWKEERTEQLVIDALTSGFTAIDTANQRKHYFEEAVGKGFQSYIKRTGKHRGDFFLQTKFTYREGQDHRLPYDPEENFSTQVQQSLESSLQHLQTDYIDSYFFHGPHGYGIHDEDFEVWEAMEKLQKSGKIKSLGISNVGLEQLEQIYNHAVVKPAFVQNRCYARQGWDRDVRTFCRKTDITYQGFSLLTANHAELTSSTIVEIARKYEKTVPQIAFAFAKQIGMVPLTGTSSIGHMKDDLAVQAGLLSPSEMTQIEQISSRI